MALPSMRVFVSEYVCGGAWPHGRPEGSLRAEGQAMLAAIVADFARIPGCHVAATWDSRLGAFPVANVEPLLPRDADDERRIVREQAGKADATLVIAPEFHGLLAERCQAVVDSGGTLLGPSPSLVKLCGDKLALCQLLVANGIETIPTRDLAEAIRDAGTPFPAVVKPRHGAGSVNTFLVRDAGEVQTILRNPLDPSDLPPDTLQPFVPGRPLSVSVLVHGDGGDFDLFPVGEQRLSNDGRFSYLGGRIPAAGVSQETLHDLVRRACAVLGRELSGYVGFDLLMPAHDPDRPLLVEINPRLTTSYLGYRSLTDGNLAERLLPSVSRRQPIRWKSARVEFLANG